MSSDPEILEPEQRAEAGAPVDLLGIVERAFPGVVLRARGHTIEVEGPHEELRVVQLPFVQVAVLRGMRIPLPPEPAQALELLRSIATGERVIVEERGAGALRRTHLVRVERERLAALEDTNNDREEVAKGVMRVVSFPAGARDATPAEREFIKRATGGMWGRLKRKVLEKVVDKTIGAVVGAVNDAAANAQGAVTSEATPKGEDGSRILPPRARDS